MNLRNERDDAIRELRKLFVDLHAPLPSETECGAAWHKRLRAANWSVSFYEALLWEIVDRRELLPDGASWLSDVEAERVVLYGMGAACQPPANLDASHFSYAYHQFLFGYLKRCRLTPDEALTTNKLVTLVLLAERGDSALELYPTMPERKAAVGWTRVGDIEAIAAVGASDHRMLFDAACHRVFSLAVRRRARHRTHRLLLMLEQATIDPKELWREHTGVGELLTELTGSDGKVDGW